MRKLKLFGLVATVLAGGAPVMPVQAQSMGQCWYNYNQAMARCDGNSQCEDWASVELGQCLDRLEQTNQ